MLFSIIVPIYNVEKYLQECIESILAQKFSDFEVILVNDGSTDNCPAICEHYVRQDARVRVIHKENGGLSSARNKGILAARGDYVVFVDSDDVFCFGALDDLSGCIHRASFPDMVIGNVIHWDGKNEKIIADNGRFLDKQERHSIYELNEFYAAEGLQLPWRAYQNICKKEFIEKNCLRFEESLTGAEDCDFYLKAISCVETYRLTAIPLVKYRMHREGSIINTVSYPSVMGQLETFAAAFGMAEYFPDQKLMKRYFADRFTNIVILVNLIGEKSERERCLTFISEHRYILQFTSKNLKYTVSKLLWNILGVERGSGVLLAIKRRLKI